MARFEQLPARHRWLLAERLLQISVLMVILFEWGEEYDKSAE